MEALIECIKALGGRPNCTVKSHCCEVTMPVPEPASSVETSSSTPSPNPTVTGSITRDSVTRDRSRAWCFTAWNEAEVLNLRSQFSPRAMVVALERTSEGREHYQGYVRFEQVVRFSWWKNQYPTWHVEARRGREWQAWQYIADVDGYLREDGAHPKDQGQVIIDYGCEKPPRNKADSPMDDVIDMINDRAPAWQIWRSHPRIYLMHCHKIEHMIDKVQSWHDHGFDYKRRRTDGD